MPSIIGPVPRPAPAGRTALLRALLALLEAESRLATGVVVMFDAHVLVASSDATAYGRSRYLKRQVRARRAGASACTPSSTPTRCRTSAWTRTRPTGRSATATTSGT